MKKKIKIGLILAVFLLLLGIIFSPSVQFTHPVSKILYDNNDQLLGGKIAEDGQWRFPALYSIPPYYEMAILSFEDKRFYKHFGIDFRALARALKQNFKEKRIVSGASTLSMQVCRMSRGHTPRTIPQKIIEMGMAIKLEVLISKKQILALHSSHAPYGGNVVGLEAASWRYYGKAPERLGLAEAALLAVLPNAPALMHPGRNRKSLRAKRDRLLLKLFNEQKISEQDYELALLEDLPTKPQPLPRKAPHLLEYAFNQNKDQSKFTSTIDRKTQNSTLQTAELFSQEFQQSDIQNLGILVLDTKTGATLAYVGNSPNAQSEVAVDMIQASRSSGSVLKPLLHAYALDDGLIAPHGLVLDVPIQYNGYTPKNYNKKFLGALKADEALAKSLNVPAVELLKKYGISRFKNKLQQQGFTTVDKSADHYGLTLILGGAEINLWELTSAYASLGRILMRFNNDQSKYAAEDLHPATIFTKEATASLYSHTPTLVSAAAIYHTFQAMTKVSRPDEEGDWQSFQAARDISWKTGTSYGHRDAWAIGVSPRYTIGVWVGNADGEGKHGLVGVKKAAPILFDVFNHLEHPGSFEEPLDDLEELAICRETGYAAGKNCTIADTVFQISTAAGLSCPYHHKICLDRDGHRVNSQCASLSQTERKSYMVLPPDAAHFYSKHHPEYKSLPPFRSDCNGESKDVLMRFIYPKARAKIFLPTDGDGEKETAIFKIVHQEPDTKLFWHVNDTYLGVTEGEHSMVIDEAAGKHLLVLVDELGNSIERKFEIVGLE